ncbi:MAG: trigger factor [Novosphingobium sp.]
MQIVETSKEGLKRAFSVTIPAAEIAARVEGEIKRMAPQMRMPGFRPGKVPANLVRKMHGPALHQDALNTTIREAMDKLVADHKLRPAMQPDVSLGEGYEQGNDATLTVALEVLPDLEAPNLDGLTLEKLVVPVNDAEVDESLERIGQGQKRFTDAKKGAKAKEGDQLIIDFNGKLDGVEFEGGKAEDQPLEIGAGRFIPGFEEQLAGAKAGDEKTITVTFPADYPAENLAGKDATFDIVVKSVKVPGELVYDDEFAKSLGLEGIDQLRGLLRGQLEQENAGLTRTQMKRALLDQLAAAHEFDVPPSMVEAEFAQIWQQLEQEAAGEEDPEAARKEMEADREDYQRIAVRRVRLGLLLSEIGQANNVQVSNQEMNMLLQQAAQQYRQEDRQRFMEYIQSDALAAAQLRAPLYEDKVVDFLFDKATVTEREVTKEELQAAIEADEDGHVHGPDCGHDHGHDGKPAKKAAAKKAPAKKAAAADEAAEAAPAEAAAEPVAEKPAKKAPAKKAAAKAEPAEAAEPAAEAKPKKAPAKKKTEA